jgi:hypothetical protein
VENARGQYPAGVTRSSTSVDQRKEPAMTTLIVLLVIEIACAALTGWIFRNHGRPAWVGVLLGLLFGLAAVVISLIVFGMAGRRGRGAATV